jgi:hypothetical protein
MVNSHNNGLLLFCFFCSKLQHVTGVRLVSGNLQLLLLYLHNGNGIMLELWESGGKLENARALARQVAEVSKVSLFKKCL